MEVHRLLKDLLAWDSSYESKISKKAWEAYIASIVTLLGRAEEVHKARCGLGNLILQEVYDEVLEKVAAKIAVVQAVAPGSCAVYRERLLSLAEEKEERLKLLWKVLDTGEHPVAQEELERLLEEQGRLLDIAALI